MYKIVGADQKEYGPISEEQMRQWIAEGRANGQTLARIDEGPWKPLSTFPEFAAALGETPAPPPIAPVPPPLATPLAGASSTFPPPTSGMAIAGVICGVLGLFCCGPILSTLALVLSAMALSQINQEPLKYSGKGVAMAGIVLALIGYAFFAVLLFTGILHKVFRGFPHRF